mmetsp:Transcript_36993/g.59459  ORF Transcript_36993/g.59459 Transcript_36993/m.59459 type:complete len:90 (-) Transcript_36993:305-574(-)
MTFFKALGGGKVRKGSLLSFLNPWSPIYKKYNVIKDDVKDSNLKGEGSIFGGLYIVSTKGVHYQFIEKNFGDAAPIDQVLKVCKTVGTA